MNRYERNGVARLLSALMLCGAVAIPAQNLITNPGFESQGSGWTLWFQSGTVAAGSVTYPDTGAHGGSRYARIDITSAAASAAENWHVQFQPQSWTAVSGTTYEFKFWAKCDVGSNIHVSVQGADYTYLTGTSFGIGTEWAEYSLTQVADADGDGAVRFHIYLGEAVDVYSFDDVSVTAVPTAIRGGVAQGAALNVLQGRDNLVVSLGKGMPGAWKADLLDVRGKVLASASSGAEGSARLKRPGAGMYVVRASTPTRAWVRKVEVR